MLTRVIKNVSVLLFFDLFTFNRVSSSNVWICASGGGGGGANKH